MKHVDATLVLNTALAQAERMGVAVCVTVVDAAAWPVTFARMDGVPLGVIDVSHKKAHTAALFHMDSAEFAHVARPNGGAYTLEATNGGLTSFGGGVVLKDAKGTIVGGIGVSGASKEDDISIAQSAARTLAA